MKMKKRKGQVLLIAVMLLATVITVVMTIAFNTTTETQVARLEADSQKALAAAEGGVEEMIKQNIADKNTTNVQIESLRQFSSQNITGDAQLQSVSQAYFVTPLLQKDEQYSLYLSDYPGYANPWSGTIDLYMVSESGCPAVEITVVKNTYGIDRYTYNACSANPIITNATAAALALTPPAVIDSISFSYKTSTKITIPQAGPGGGLMAFIKVLGGRTKIGIKSFEMNGFTAKALPVQGKTIESEARTASGVVKRVQLFQSFPQIPSNFFMTSF